jgi:hypothetical protein
MKTESFSLSVLLSLLIAVLVLTPQGEPDVPQKAP